jgi:hypothetical protein
VTTQSDVDGHETAVGSFDPGAAAALAQVPEAGSVEVSTFPGPSAATQRVSVAQDTESIGVVPSTLWRLHSAGLVGSVELTMFPSWSTATQSAIDGQETPNS